MSKILIVLALVGMAGCASVGNQFKYQATDSYGRDTLEIGAPSIRYADIFGEPGSTVLKDTPDGKFRLLQYTYSHANLSDANAKSLALEFRNELLNAYNFVSSFDEDKTLMAGQLSQINRGVSKESDVLRLLGKPGGIGKCPSILEGLKDKCDKDLNIAKVWVWTVMEALSTMGATYAGKQVQFAITTISFDKYGIVTSVETSSNKP